MKLTELEGKHLLLIGMGKEGQATYNFLKKHLKTAQIETADEQDGPGYLDKQTNFELAIKSPGVPPRLVTIPYTTSTNIFFANFKGFSIGITGTKGKSTTTKLTYDILKAAGKKVALAGNIGVPLLQVLDEFNDSDGITVCELSSYQLEGFNYAPNIAVITNLYHAHVPHHGSWEKYVAAKANITARAQASDCFIYNPAFEELRQIAKQTKAQAVEIEKSPLAQSPQLPGTFNGDNIRTAQTIAHVLKIDDAHIKTAMEKFEPLPHRLQFIGEHHGIKFYDDAASSTPESTVAALQTLDNIKTLLLGGENRDYDFSEIAQLIKTTGIKNIVLFPDSDVVIEKLLPKDQVNILKTRSMAEAVEFAYKNTPSGGICLLSTGAPSFTVWKNFEIKGQQFQQEVAKQAS